MKQLDVTSNLETKKNVQLVRTDFLWQYVEHDRNVVKIPGRAKNYLNKLKVAIKKEGLRHPLIFCPLVKKRNAHTFMKEITDWLYFGTKGYNGYHLKSNITF